MNRERKLLLRYGILAITALGIIVVINWLYNNGRLAITMPEGSKLVIIVPDDTSRDSDIIQTTDGSLTRTLNTGSYQIYVRDDSSLETYFSSVSVGRFLTGPTVQAELKPEYGREFVGETPGSCSEFSGSAHYSFGCDGSLLGIKYHIPGTEIRATYGRDLGDFARTQVGEFSSDPPGTIEAIIPGQDGKMIVMAHQKYGNSGDHKTYEVSLRRDKPEYIFLKVSDKLVGSVSYSSGKDGDLLFMYNESLESVYRGSNFENLERVTLNRPIAIDETANSFDMKGDDFVISIPTVRESNTESIKNPETTIRLSHQGNFKDIKLDEGIEKVEFCGESICALDTSGEFWVFDYNLNVKNSLSQVSSFLTTPSDELYLVSNYGAVNMNPETGEGFVVFNPNTINTEIESISYTSRGLVLTFFYGAKSHAVLLSADNERYPDRRLAPLADNSFVESFVMYGNRVYVSTDLGELVYNEELEIFDYDPGVITEIKSSIESSISESGLESIGYEVINPVLDLY